jgi:DNA-binding response OmpR family regulator
MVYISEEIREKIARFLLYFYCKIDERRCFKGYKAGADDYLNKPLIPLLMKIKAIIQRKSLILKRNKFNMNSTLENFTLIQN